MAATIKCSTAIQWGTTRAGTTTLGVILSSSRKRSSEVFEQKNAIGESHSVICYGPKDEITVEILANTDAKRSASPPRCGSPPKPVTSSPP